MIQHLIDMMMMDFFKTLGPKVSFSLVSLLGKNIVACFIESFMVRYCHLVIFEFWGILGLIMFGNVGFVTFLKCCFFFDHGAIWTMLVAYGILTM